TSIHLRLSLAIPAYTFSFHPFERLLHGCSIISDMKERTLPRLLPELAKSVWNAQWRPSARRVARALTQAGHPVHYTTINRWRSQGWRAIKGEHPLDAARANLDSAVPVLTGDPTTNADDLADLSQAKAELEKLSDKELLAAAARAALIT